MVSRQLLIEAKNVGKKYPGVTALNRVDFDLEEGEVHVLLGENGAGKSTFVNILSGNIQADEGRLFLQGREVFFSHPSQAWKAGIATIYQNQPLVPQVSVAANIFLGQEIGVHLLPFIINHGELEKQANQWLQELELGLKPKALLKHLTSAEQQLVAIIKAIARKVKVLILDEPTAPLTDKEVMLLFLIINKMKENGVGIIYISHRLEEVKKLADRITIFRDGQKVTTLNNSSVNAVNLTQLIRLMTGREIKDKYPKEKLSLGKSLLKVNELTKYNVFKDVSFSLRAGEILGIAGLVGSGKSQIGAAIGGVIPFDKGWINIAEDSLRKISPEVARDNGLFYLPSDRKGQGLFLDLPLKSNLTICALPGHGPFLNLHHEEQMCQAIMKELMIKAPSILVKVKKLSGGNQQKVLLGRALLGGAKILILDEPTSGIDVASRVEIYRQIGQLLRKGVGILLISSDLDELMGLSDEIIVISGGRITGQFAASKVDKQRVLAHMFSQEIAE